jgi:hypothetical protein
VHHENGDEFMILDAEVKEDGTLVARAPRYLSGKKVRIVIRDKTKFPSNWSAIVAILSEADRLGIPRRSFEEILDGIRDFRGRI